MVRLAFSLIVHVTWHHSVRTIYTYVHGPVYMPYSAMTSSTFDDSSANDDNRRVFPDVTATVGRIQSRLPECNKQTPHRRTVIAADRINGRVVRRRSNEG